MTDLARAKGRGITDADQPLAAGERHVLAGGDRILMGAWTCLTVQGAPAAAVPDGDPGPDTAS